MHEKRYPLGKTARWAQSTSPSLSFPVYLTLQEIQVSDQSLGKPWYMVGLIWIAAESETSHENEAGCVCPPCHPWDTWFIQRAVGNSQVAQKESMPSWLSWQQLFTKTSNMNYGKTISQPNRMSHINRKILFSGNVLKYQHVAIQIVPMPTTYDLSVV